MSWLWRNDSSAASFEKVLAKLSGQISAATVSLDKTRSRNRRAKALWTLYTSLAYLISAVILVLVIGPQDWSVPHYGGLVGGPLLIYGVRKAITVIFGWSIARQQSHVQRLQKQREAKIAELKKATKFDSTQELLAKYGGAPPPKPQEEDSKQGSKRKMNDSQPQSPVQRTGLPPPPTANIPSRTPPRMQTNPQQGHSARAPTQSPQNLMHSPSSLDEPGFAPNAFSEAPASRAAHEHTPHWYDRILDIMLGEDESLAKNRLALLCQKCRLVNGQAPPGVKTLEELGRWRCQACGAWNGVQAEAAKVVQEATSARAGSPIPTHTQQGEEEPTSDESQAIEEQQGTTGLDDESKDNVVTKRTIRSTGKSELDGV